MVEDLYTQDPEQVFETLGSSPGGLTASRALVLLEEYGPNVIEEKKGTPLWKKFLKNFTHFFAILLWIGGILAFVGNTPELGYAIFAVIFINAIFTFWQEYKAEKAIEALKNIMPMTVRVIRDGEEMEMEAKDVVSGDVLVLESGDKIPADARLISAQEMKTNNSALTGESEPQRRFPEAVREEGMAMVDLPNLIFAGTNVVAGSGRAVAYATGMSTEFGKIARLTQAVKEEPSPLQKQMGKITKVIGTIAVGLGVLFFLLGNFVMHLDSSQSFLFAVGIIVANVPEGLLPTVTLSLAIGTQRMARRNALIKKLSCVETLGCTTVICTDKTGTLTQNEMTVRNVWIAEQDFSVTGVGYEPRGEFKKREGKLSSGDREGLELALRIASLCNNSRLIEPGKKEAQWKILGDPTEGALVVAARKYGIDGEKIMKELPRHYEFPFDSRRKRMTTIHTKEGGALIFTKGAPIETLKLCDRIWEPTGVRDIKEDDLHSISEQNDRYAQTALRVLAVTYKEDSEVKRRYQEEDVESGLIFVGLIGMMDPPRPEVEEAVKRCRKAGIRVIMITGDYGVTAESIARRTGLVKGRQVRVLSGVDLDGMDDEQLSSELEEGEIIFARVSPEHKMQVAKLLKERGEIVAMTGDGVNDAPALKMADIGVAMGISGTDVAKEAADMILTDDNFASIVNAVEEGRAVYDNIKRFVTYILASNIPEIVPFLLFVIAKVPLPLTVMQILAVDLGTDMVPALALGTEKPEPGVMERPPRPQKERLLNLRLLARAYGFLGPIEALACMASYFFVQYQFGWWFGLPLAASGPVYMKATTACLACIVCVQIGNGFACRSNRESIFKIGFTTNRFYLWAILSEVAIINLFIFVPPFNRVFALKPLGWNVWAFMIIWAPIILFASELRKLIIRKVERSKEAKEQRSRREAEYQEAA